MIALLIFCPFIVAIIVGGFIERLDHECWSNTFK